MRFQAIADEFSACEACSDSFKRLSRRAYALMKEDPENAIAYFLIAVAARSYVARYEDQAVEVAQAERAKSAMLALSRRVEAALACEEGERLQLLGAIAIDYEFSTSEF